MRWNVYMCKVLTDQVGQSFTTVLLPLRLRDLLECSSN